MDHEAILKEPSARESFPPSRGICHTVYAKVVKDDLTTSERDAWRKAVEAIEYD